MLDIYDLNYEFCSEKLGNLNIPAGSLPRKGIMYRIFSLIRGVIKYGFEQKSNEFIGNKKILFFVASQNEINSVKPIVDKLNDSILFGNDTYKNGFPFAQIYFYSLFFIPIVFYNFFLCKDKYLKRSYSYAFDGFCLAYSSNYVLKKYLCKIEPSKIIIANQLSCYHRSLAYVAKKIGIETVYIQHASVTENFSNLNNFSSAILEGRDSLIKYQKNGTSGLNLYLIGMPKFDKYFSEIKKNGKLATIGICTNGMDDIVSFSKVIEILRIQSPDLEIIIRPHPSDRRYFEWFELSTKYNCSFSDVRKTESFLFFKDVDLIIAGDSNIHLEAALLNIHSIYFDSFGNHFDWYGFASNNLVYYAVDPHMVGKYIHSVSQYLPEIRYKAKFYVDTVLSKFDGNSSMLAAMIINDEDVTSCFNVSLDKNNNRVHSVKEQ